MDGQPWSKTQPPDALVPGTCTVITANGLPASREDPEAVLASSDKAYISRHALGRDYHKLVRGTAKLAKRIEAQLVAANIAPLSIALPY